MQYILKKQLPRQCGKCGRLTAGGLCFCRSFPPVWTDTGQSRPPGSVVQSVNGIRKMMMKKMKGRKGRKKKYEAELCPCSHWRVQLRMGKERACRHAWKTEKNTLHQVYECKMLLPWHKPTCAQLSKPNLSQGRTYLIFSRLRVLFCDRISPVLFRFR